MESLDFLSTIFVQLPGGNLTRPGEFIFLIYIFPLKSLNLVLISGVKLDGHRDTWTGYLKETELLREILNRKELYNIDWINKTNQI